jgi:glyoxylase-like metal-dependent hydrolase (beta-lactamase superfamily II)
MTRARSIGVLVMTVVAIGLLLFAGRAVWKHRQYSVTTEKVADGLYVFVGSGMNATALITDDGVVLVDTMQDGWWGPALEAALRGVTDKPVTLIINTNSHPPHSGNNWRFGGDKVEIVSHELTKSRLERLDSFKGANAKFLPRTTFRDRLSLVRGKDPIELYNFGAANTDGDVWVVFPSRRAMHIGDIVKKNDLPEISRQAGGSGIAYPVTMARAIATIKDVDLVIAGHERDDSPRPTLTWSELAAHQRQMDVLLAAVQQEMKTATSAQGVVTALSKSAAFQRFDPRRLDEAVQAIYAELLAAREHTARAPDLWHLFHAPRWLQPNVEVPRTSSMERLPV